MDSPVAKLHDQIALIAFSFTASSVFSCGNFTMTLFTAWG